MAKKGNQDKAGKIVFFVGAVLAVLAGLVSSAATYPYTPLILVILGIIVGLLNISSEEVTAFLLGTIALIISTATAGAIIGGYIGNVLDFVSVFTAGAALIVSLKEVYGATKN